MREGAGGRSSDKAGTVLNSMARHVAIELPDRDIVHAETQKEREVDVYTHFLEYPYKRSRFQSGSSIAIAPSCKQGHHALNTICVVVNPLPALTLDLTPWPPSLRPLAPLGEGRGNGGVEGRLGWLVRAIGFANLSIRLCGRELPRSHMNFDLARWRSSFQFGGWKSHCGALTAVGFGCKIDLYHLYHTNDIRHLRDHGARHFGEYEYPVADFLAD
jgi:hypothetical protein